TIRKITLKKRSQLRRTLVRPALRKHKRQRGDGLGRRVMKLPFCFAGIALLVVVVTVPEWVAGDQLAKTGFIQMSIIRTCRFPASGSRTRHHAYAVTKAYRAIETPKGTPKAAPIGTAILPTVAQNSA